MKELLAVLCGIALAASWSCSGQPCKSDVPDECGWCGLGVLTCGCFGSGDDGGTCQPLEQPTGERFDGGVP